MAAQIIEVAPGLDIEPLTDVALKSTDVQAGVLVVERQFGYLEIHSRSTEAVRSASAAVLDALDTSASSATKPTVLASRDPNFKPADLACVGEKPSSLMQLHQETSPQFGDYTAVVAPILGASGVPVASSERGITLATRGTSSWWSARRSKGCRGKPITRR